MKADDISVLPRTVSRLVPLFAVGRVAIFIVAAATIRGEAPNAVSEMLATETVVQNQHPHGFYYISEERSTRTAGRLWKEKVVENGDSVLRRLISIDGKPLTPTAAAAEERRLSRLVEQPSESPRVNQDRLADRTRSMQLLRMLPRAFLLSPAGGGDEYVHFRFRPDPAFRPSTNEERFVAALEGTINIKEPEHRLPAYIRISIRKHVDPLRQTTPARLIAQIV